MRSHKRKQLEDALKLVERTELLLNEADPDGIFVEIGPEISMLIDGIEQGIDRLKEFERTLND